MLVRYTRDESGKTVQQALIYTSEEHKIQPKDIDPEAIKIARRLRASGHSADIVGGAVRESQETARYGRISNRYSTVAKT